MPPVKTITRNRGSGFILARQFNGSAYPLRQRALTARPAKGVSETDIPCPLRQRGLYVIFDGKRLLFIFERKPKGGDFPLLGGAL